MIAIKNKEDCCGCGGCYSICPKNAIKMIEDNEGFLYPSFNSELCSNCGLCEKACPIINEKKELKVAQKAYLVQNKNEKVLKESTSGGAFTAIAEYIIKNDGVVFGASYDKSFKVVHSKAEKIEDIRKFRNSKYVQSDTNDTFKDVKKLLKSGKLVCYSGTPCQIEGLKSFLINDYENLITVDVVCHAAPSPLIWEKYKSFISEGSKIKKAVFRDKNFYGYDYSQMTVCTSAKRYHEGVDTDPYLRAFFSNLSDRPSCYDCRFKKRYRIADITIWDCFDAGKFNKKLDNNKGVTRVLTHSDKGNKIVKAILNSFIYTEVEADQLVDGVREMIASVPVNPKRTLFFKDANTMNDADFFKKYFPMNAKVKTERTVRHLSQKLGIYKIIKRTAKKILGK